MLAYLINFLKALNSNSKPSQIANSFCIGLILGFMPKNNLLWYVIFIFFAFVRINKCGYYIMIIIGTLCAYLLDPLFDKIGYAVLHLLRWKIFTHGRWMFRLSDLQNSITQLLPVRLHSGFWLTFLFTFLCIL